MTFQVLALSALLAAPGATPTPAVRMGQAWRVRLPEAFTASHGDWLVATDRSVYVAGQELTAATGRKRRGLLRPLFEDGEMVREPPELEQIALEGGRVFLLGRFHYGGDVSPGDFEKRERIQRDRALTAADVRTGRQLWRLDGQLGDPLEAAGGRVLVVLDDRLTALDASSGKVRWQAPAEWFQGVEGTATAGGIVAVEGSRGGEGWVSALSADDGHLRWETRLPGTAYAGPAPGRDAFLVIREGCPGKVSGDACETPDATLYALDRATGAIRWQRTFPRERSMFRPPAVSGDRVYAVTDTAVHAVSERTGAELWSRAVVADDVSQDSRPVFAGDEVLLWSGDAAEHERWDVSSTWRLLALDAASGAPRRTWTPRRMSCDRDANGPQLSRPFVLGRDLVYSDGACVYRMRPAGGRGTRPALR